MALFLSTFENKIDKKGRVSLPAQFRASLASQDSSGIIVYESFVNDCIEGCDISRIKQLSESIDNLDPFSSKRDAMATTVLGGAIQLPLDGDGRIILPESLLKKAGLGEKAVFIGKGPTFEIWNPEKFAKYLEKAKATAKENLGQLKLARS
ncbi:MAG: division/cell wall cluster transcriptional repressor MraZ [Pseudomonadota bacterium]